MEDNICLTMLVLYLNEKMDLTDMYFFSTEYLDFWKLR